MANKDWENVQFLQSLEKCKSKLNLRFHLTPACCHSSRKQIANACEDVDQNIYRYVCSSLQEFNFCSDEMEGFEQSYRIMSKVKM